MINLTISNNLISFVNPIIFIFQDGFLEFDEFVKQKNVEKLNSEHPEGEPADKEDTFFSTQFATYSIGRDVCSLGIAFHEINTK